MLVQKAVIFTVIYRTVFFYVLLIGVIRLMGKRQVGQMEPSEFAVTMFLANLASMPVEKEELSLWLGLAAMGTVLVLERVLSAVSLRSVGLRRLLCGKPVVLIDNGKLLMENLRRTRVNLDELSGHLREKGVLEIQSVQFAILETNGTLTVFPFSHLQPPCAADTGTEVKQMELPYTVVTDGTVMEKNLTLAGKDRVWLRDKLEGRPVKDVALMTLTPGGKTHIIWKS